jgi:NarL family two-component system response regulator YdfI
VIRVFIVAGSSLVRAGLQNLIRTREIEIVGSTSNLDLLAGLWPEIEADIVLVEASGEQFGAMVNSLVNSEFASESAIVIITDQPESRLVADALRRGVRAVFPSNVAHEQLIPALEAAAAGLTVLHAEGVAAMFPAAQMTSRSSADLAEPLTPREKEVLQMLANGLANKEIASRLAISEHTVKFHVASILGKLGAGSRTEAVSLGIRRGLVPL